MRAHGVPAFPDPGSDGRPTKAAIIQAAHQVSSSVFRAAGTACGHLLPAGPPPLTAGQQQDYLRAAACMRAHGIASFPDPTFSQGTAHFTIPAGIDINSPQVTHARQICQRLIPAGLPYSGSDG